MASIKSTSATFTMINQLIAFHPDEFENELKCDEEVEWDEIVYLRNDRNKITDQSLIHLNKTNNILYESSKTTGDVYLRSVNDNDTHRIVFNLPRP